LHVHRARAGVVVAVVVVTARASGGAQTPRSTTRFYFRLTTYARAGLFKKEAG
jgi:hypothetical protein